MTNQQLMQWAKAQLQGGWLMAALATLIVGLIEMVAGYTVIVTLLVAGPFSYGYFLYLNRQVDYKEQDFNLLFHGFSTRFVQTMVAGLLVTLATYIGLCLLIVPGIIVAMGFSMTYLIND